MRETTKKSATWLAAGTAVGKTSCDGLAKPGVLARPRDSAPISRRLVDQHRMVVVDFSANLLGAAGEQLSPIYETIPQDSRGEIHYGEEQVGPMKRQTPNQPWPQRGFVESARESVRKQGSEHIRSTRKGRRQSSRM